MVTSYNSFISLQNALVLKLNSSASVLYLSRDIYCCFLDFGTRTLFNLCKKQIKSDNVKNIGRMFAPVCLIFCVLLGFGDSSGSDYKLKLVDISTRSLTVQAGKTARLKCEFISWQQEWRMVWKVNGKVIQVKKKKTRFRQRDGKTAKLRIKKVVKADSGIYECIASNDHGRVRKRLNLTVVGVIKPRGEHGKGPPWFTKDPKPQYVAWPVSSDSKLVCPADGEPPLKYQWLKDGKVPKYRRLDPKFNTTRQYLKIKTAVPSDDGYYTCVVSNRLGNISHRIEVIVIEKRPVRPILSAQFPVNKTARIGDNVTFQCIELFSPILTDYRWLHWNKLPPSYPDLGFGGDSPWFNSSYYKLVNSKHYQSFPVAIPEGKYGGRVLLTNVTKKDEGMYTCLVSNHIGKDWKSAFLRVLDDGIGRGEHGKGPPWFTKNPKPQFVAWPASSDMKLVCPADGEPPLKYQWLKDGKVLKYRRLDPKFNTTRWYLRIKTAVPSDDGYYTCVVSNRLGNISHRIQVNVIEKRPVRPILSAQFPVNKTARIGDNVTFQCIELFSPILTDYRWIHWNKLPPNYPDLGFGDDSPWFNPSYYKLVNPKHYQSFPVAIPEKRYGGRVLLTNVTKKDEGMYTCLVSNYIGKDWKSAFLRVLDHRIEVPTGKPEFVPETRQAKVGETVRLKCALTDWHVSWRMIWYGNGEMIRPRMDSRFRLVIGKSSFLVINDVRKGDAGIFECVASNAFGTVSKKFNLTVVD